MPENALVHPRHPMSTQRQLLVACGVALAIAIPARLHAQEFWSTVGFSEDDMKSRLLSGLTEANFRPPTVPALRGMPSAARNSLLTSATSYTKRWVQTADFRQRYAALRESRKPEMPEAAMTLAQRKAHDKAEFQKAIRSMDSAMVEARGNPEIQAGLRQMIQQLKDQIKEVDDPANPMYSKEAQAMLDEQSADARAEYAKALKEWESKYPVSPAPLIKQSLRAFLALAASVDFAAKVQQSPRGGSTFVNPDYESKPDEWKALYRLGRETTAALQAAAKQWLVELK